MKIPYVLIVWMWKKPQCDISSHHNVNDFLFSSCKDTHTQTADSYVRREFIVWSEIEFFDLIHQYLLALTNSHYFNMFCIKICHRRFCSVIRIRFRRVKKKTRKNIHQLIRAQCARVQICIFIIRQSRPINRFAWKFNCFKQKSAQRPHCKKKIRNMNIGGNADNNNK